MEMCEGKVWDVCESHCRCIYEQGYAISQEVDSRLRCSAEQLGYFKECVIIDTTKYRTKERCLEEIAAAINDQ